MLRIREDMLFGKLRVSEAILRTAVPESSNLVDAD